MTTSTLNSATAHLQPDADHVVQPEVQSGGARTSSNDEEYTYDFRWERPRECFDSLAGMQPLKAELLSTIKRFRHYQYLPGYAGLGGEGNGSSSAGGGLDGVARSPVPHRALQTAGVNQKPGVVGIADQNGILLSGPPGNGKTAFARAIAAELNLPFVKLGCADLSSKWVNESARMIKDVFRQAAMKPCVLFFDEFDGVAFNRSCGQVHAEDRKVVNTLLSEIDTARRMPIVLIAATNFPDQIDAAIARPGRFDFAIDIPHPDLEARTAIIRTLLDQQYKIVDRVTLERVGKLWERRSIAFIESTIKRVCGVLDEKGSFRAYMDDFKRAARAVSKKASAIPVDGPKLSDIALPSCVRKAANSLVYRLKHWEEIADRGGEPATGVMLSGPPGTGKTMFVKALARELGDWHVFEVCASDVIQNPKAFSETVELAMTHRPAIVFLDEADELLARRNGQWSSGATNAILKTMDGFGGHVPEVVFMAATNRLEEMDPAALRGGRFSEQIHMDLLAGDELEAFIDRLIRSRPQVSFAPDVNAKAIARKLGQAAPADVVALISQAVNESFGKDA